MSRRFDHIAVIMGGLSAEREASLATGRTALAALQAENYRTSEIDAGKQLAQQLAECQPDAVFNALHGTWGEDGCVQGLLEVMGLAYTHSGVLASALAMDKDKAKALFAAAGLPLAESRTVARDEAARQHVLPPPYAVKPLAQGSSVGVMIVPEGANTPPAALTSSGWQWGEKVMVETYIPGRELTCGVMDDKALDVCEILPAGNFYDYASKYDEGGSRHIVPAQLDSGVSEDVRAITLAAHKTLGCRGITRADFRYDPDDGAGLVLLEINTQPGMTPTSLLPEIAACQGITINALIRWITEDASCPR